MARRQLGQRRHGRGFGTLALVATCIAAGCSDDAAPEESTTGFASGLEGLGVVTTDFDRTGLDERDPRPEPDDLYVFATVETDPVASGGDAADDPAIWVDADDPTRSVVIGTDKAPNGGLYVYDLDGKTLQFVAGGALNNVDLRSDVDLLGGSTTLVTATNRDEDTLVVHRFDPESRTLSEEPVGRIDTVAGNYGTCMYHSRSTGAVYAFVNNQAGAFQQFRLEDGEDGAVEGVLVRSFCVETQPEGCVADDFHGALFVGEEGRGIWKFAAEPDGEAPGDETPNCDGALAGTLVDDISGNIVADVEGLAIADDGDGKGYLIASNQGDNAYLFYDRQAPHAFLHGFQIWGGGPACLDGVNETDGLDVTMVDLGEAFPEGMLVVQDGSNGDPAAGQNYKFVPLQDALAPRDVADGVPEAESCFVSDLGGGTLDDELPDGPERTTAFCETFCARCDVCYTMPETGFAEGDCHFMSPKPIFELEDCRAGCASGMVPSSTGPLTSGWEMWPCEDLDQAL